MQHQSKPNLSALIVSISFYYLSIFHFNVVNVKKKASNLRWLNNLAIMGQAVLR